jgi:hypothetical protein
MKQTAVEWFLTEFQKQVWFEPDSELDIWIKDLIKKVRKKDKRQIKTIFQDACLHREKYYSMNRSIESEDYYLEKYTNEIPDYLKKFNKKTRKK